MRDNRLSMELQFNRRTASKVIFDAFSKERAAIDAEFGEPLEWLRLDDQIRSKIAIVTTKFRLTDRDQWPQQHACLLDRLLKLKNVFGDRIRKFQMPDGQEEPGLK